MTKKILNGIEIDLSGEEIHQQVLDALENEKNFKEYLAKEEAHKQARASALAKLSALGLTEEEVKSIL